MLVVSAFVSAGEQGEHREAFLKSLAAPGLISATPQWEKGLKGCQDSVEPLLRFQRALKQNTRDYHNFYYNCFHNNKTTQWQYLLPRTTLNIQELKMIWLFLFLKAHPKCFYGSCTAVSDAKEAKETLECQFTKYFFLRFRTFQCFAQHIQALKQCHLSWCISWTNTKRDGIVESTLSPNLLSHLSICATDLSKKLQWIMMPTKCFEVFLFVCFIFRGGLATKSCICVKEITAREERVHSTGAAGSLPTFFL